MRLLGEANRHGNDPELFAGLVHACRYCGLYDESIAAHAEARRLDPNVPTSLGQTLLLTGDIERLLAVEPPPLGTGSDEWIQARVTGLGLAGRRDESRQVLAEMRQVPRVSAFQAWGDFLMAWLDRRPADMLAGLSALSPLKVYDDPEFRLPRGMVAVRCGRARARASRIFGEPSPRRTLWLRRSRKVGRSIRCEAIHASRRSWRKRKWADSKRWPLSAKPEESDSSAGDAPVSTYK